ncbi:MAG: heavy metal translocating P-type ATPase [Chloroflexota bacterium]
MRRNTWSLIKHYPVPLIAALGLVAGSIITWLLDNSEAGNWVWFGALVVAGAPLVWQTLRGMLRGEFASDVVAMLAIVTAVVMYEPFAGLLVTLMQSGGEALDDYGFRRASSSLEALIARAPRTARRKSGDTLDDIAAGEVLVGDVLVVRPGELVPVDGIMLSDEAEVDESALTGEPIAHPKKSGDNLMSGSVNGSSMFEMRATAVSEQSQYARIVALVRKAQGDKAPMVRLADRFAVWFTPLTLLVCGFGWLVTGEARTILAVLVVATPCPLILAAPIAVISGINRAAREGIIVKGGTAIEQVGRAQAVVFDKTGTLTLGSPVVSRVISLNGLEANDLLRRAASVEQLSSHLLGQAMAQGAVSRGLPLSLPDEFVEVPGRGVRGRLDGQQITVGSLKYVSDFMTEDRACALTKATAQLPEGTELSALVSIDNEPAGIVLFNDEMRARVPVMMERLHRLGVKHTVMLTGDRLDNAKRVAEQAGIEEVEADLLPQEKVLAVQRLQGKYEPLIMVGDGINDAPALAAATVGIAMGARGTGISAEAADIVLLVDDVSKVVEIIAIGQRTRGIVLQSIGIGLGVSLVLMLIASFGFIPAPVGALLQEGLDVFVILNALRAR